MTLEQAREILNAELLTRSPLQGTVSAAAASDLLSDVLAFTPPHSILLTGLVSLQSVRSAEMVDAAAVCFVGGMRPELPTLELAESIDLPLMATTLSMFEACGRLYAHGLRGGGER